MLGGDEVGAIVLDIGSAISKGGYAGDDTPTAVFPSAVGVMYSSGNDNVVGEGPKAVGDEMDVDESSSSSSSKSAKRTYYVGTESLAFRRDNSEVQFPMDNGLISDWEVAEQLWNHAFSHRLRVDPKEHPILLAEPSFNTRAHREKMTELMFEKYEIPACFLSKNAVLACFAAGRATGMVLDAGWGTTSAVPVYDGFALVDAIEKTPLAGTKLVDELLHVLRNDLNADIKPPFMVSKKEIASGKFQVRINEFPLTHPSYHEYSVKSVVNDILRSICQVSEEEFDVKANINIPKLPYELPDGTGLDIGYHRFLIPECLFRPNQLHNPEQQGWKSLQQLTYDSISACDPDIRKELFNSILVTGGNSLYDGFDDRLKLEMTRVAPTQRLKTIASNYSVERKFGVWIGGSILASLGSFQQMWMSKSEYEERGKSLVERKCP